MQIPNAFPAKRLHTWRRAWLALVAGAGGAMLGWSAQAQPAASLYPDLAAKPAAPARGHIRAKFLGTATVLLDDGVTAIMTDGFFTRPSLPEMTGSALASNPARVDEALREADVHRLAALLVSHSHYDHALDSATVAEKTGAAVYGSPSTANVLRGAGLPEQAIHVFHDGDRFTIGRWRVRVFRTPHSLPVSFPGEIDVPLRQPAPASEFKEGGNYSFLLRDEGKSILVVPSANYTPGKFTGVHADVVFLSIGALGKQDEAFAGNYWDEVVRRTGAKIVVPIHWDNFMLPLDEPLQPLPKQFDDFGRGMQSIISRAKRDGVKIILPTPFINLDLGL